MDGNIYILSSNERQQLIITELLQKDKPVTVKELRKLTGVSETTILKDLDAVEEWLNKRNLNLVRKRNYGIKICGDETDFRRGICDILKEFADLNQLFGFLEQAKDLKILTNQNKYLNKLLGDTELIKINEIVRKAEKLLGFKFADGAFAGLIIHIAIAVKRLKEGKDIQIPKEKLEEIRNKAEFQMGIRLAEMIEEKFNIKLPVEETGYLTLHLMGAKIRQQFENSIAKKTNEDLLIKKLALEIASTAEGILEIPLTKDKQFIKGLMLHLKPTISRLEFDLRFSNPLLEDIKKKYPEYFRAAQLASQVLKGQLKRDITEDEIGFIALHIGAAVERNKPVKGQEIRVILVCSSGIGTTNILATRLKKEFPNMKIVGISSAFEAKTKAVEKKADAIISTIPLKADEIPVILVNPLLNEEDIDNLKKILPSNEKLYETQYKNSQDINNLINSIYEIIENYAFVIDEYSLKNQLTNLLSTLETGKILDPEHKDELPSLKQLLTEKFIKLKLTAENWEDAVRQTGTILLENNTIKEGYIEEMINVIKKHGPYIVIKKGIALMHARPSDGVKKLSVSLGVFPDGVIFGHPERDPVYLVFAFGSLDNTSHLLALKELMKLIVDKRAIEEIKNSSSTETVIKIINQKLGSV